MCFPACAIAGNGVWDERLVERPFVRHPRAVCVPGDHGMGSTDLMAEVASPSLDTSADGWARFAPTIRGEGTDARRAWQSSYVRRAVVFDAGCAAVAALVSYLLWYGVDPVSVSHPPLWEVVALPLIWLPAMVVARAYEKRFLWIGVEEYRRVLGAAVVLLAGVGFVAGALDLRVARGLVVLALPLATALTLLQRFGHRHWLYRQ